MNTSHRLHALDNLRGIMMWLGIVLHVAVNHMSTTTSIVFRDTQRSVAADVLLMVIHSFRMPVFFMLSGFFVMQMIERCGYEGMARHRLRRLALPFVMFWPVLAILTAVLVLNFLHVMKFGTFGFDPSTAVIRHPGEPRVGTMHLWFLYDLLCLCMLTALAGRIGLRVPLSLRTHAIRVISSWWGLPLLAFPLALIGTLYPHGIIAPTLSFVPCVPELFHFGLFFVAGSAMYCERNLFMRRLEATSGRHALVGLICMIVTMGLLKSATTQPTTSHSPDVAIAFFYNCTAWCWSFALIGGFIRFAPGKSRWMSYLSESSYWVYLVHMLGTIGFGILLYQLPIGFAAKFALNVTATTVVCLLSYHFFVRNTAIGVLLNGRRHRTQYPATAAISISVLDTAL